MITGPALLQHVRKDILGVYPDLGPPACETWDANRFACAMLLDKLLSKQTEVLDRDVCDRVALETFLNVNSVVGSYQRRQCHEWEEELYGTFKAAVYDFFYPCGDPLLNDWCSIASRGALGPGSNIGVDGTDFYTKLFSSDLTVSDISLYASVYRATIQKNHIWREAEETRLAHGYRVVVASENKLEFVPKNDRTSRVIAIEPTLNMFLQRGISSFIEERLLSYGIDLSIQPEVNRKLAQLGSVDGSLSTIDLSSASDSISLGFVRDVIPRQQLAFFEGVRSRATRIPSGELVELKMLSTMGNGYTFSLQTAIFTCMVIAAHRYAGIPMSAGPRKSWGVFGDDIIVPSGKVTRLVLTLLEICGFAVNREKTFTEGPFRESCGGDYLVGHNVRPVYAKRWTTLPERYTLHNRLTRWSKDHIPLETTLRWIEASLPLGRHLVPEWFPDSSGIQIDGYTAIRSGLGNRGGGLTATYLVPRPSDLEVYEHWIIPPRGGRQRCMNPDGLFVAILQGSVRGSGPRSLKSDVSGRLLRPLHQAVIGTRQSAPRYGTKRVTIPNWDHPGKGVLIQHA